MATPTPWPCCASGLERPENQQVEGASEQVVAVLVGLPGHEDQKIYYHDKSSVYYQASERVGELES